MTRQFTIPRRLTVLLLAVCLLLPTGCHAEQPSVLKEAMRIAGLSFRERLPLQYADQFAIDRYDGGYSLISVADGARYLILPPDGKRPEKLDNTVKVLRRPSGGIYLAATAAMAAFEALDCGSAVRFSGIQEKDWYIDYAKNAMNSGEMLYAGKYREPDYEMLLTGGCELAIESTMIEHSPEVREKLEELGIPVFVDYSSYEKHPLGRSEWVKVYGELLGKTDEADALFEEQSDRLASVGSHPDTGKTVVFFYINSAGQAVTRKSGDYVSKMIELAGGRNAFSDLDTGNATSTVRIELERFFATAKDADIFIYDSTIGNEPQTIADLTAKSELLAECRAVKEGQVWCAADNLFQATLKLGDVIADFHAVFSGAADGQPPKYLYRLEDDAV